MQENQNYEGVRAFEAFVAKNEEDEELEAKVEEISQSDELDIAPLLIRLGADYGFCFTEQDIGHYVDQARELTHSEMEMVSGGCGSTASGAGKMFGQWAKTKCFTAECAVAVPGGAKSVRDMQVVRKRPTA